MLPGGGCIQWKILNRQERRNPHFSIKGKVRYGAGNHPGDLHWREKKNPDAFLRTMKKRTKPKEGCARKVRMVQRKLASQDTSLIGGEAKTKNSGQDEVVMGEIGDSL